MTIVIIDTQPLGAHHDGIYPRAQMNDLRYEVLLLRQQVSDLAMVIDPKCWEAIVRESGIIAAQKLDMDLKDAKTSPSIRAQTIVIWKAPGCVVERMGIK